MSMATRRASSLLSKAEIKGKLARLKDWKLAARGKAIRAEYSMKDFAAAIALIGKIAKAAEAMDHHPDIHLTSYRSLALELSTHSLGGLSDNDFRLAAGISRFPKKLKAPL